MLVDSHAHLLYFSPEERQLVIQNFLNAGVSKVLNISTKCTELDELLASSKGYSEIFHTIGTHPCNVHEEPNITHQALIEIANQHKTIMTWNAVCNLNSRYCGSGCCTSFGNCANDIFSCTYSYSDYSTNSTYTYPGYYSSKCNSLSRNCVSGCCTSTGSCANTLSTCTYKYSDYNSNFAYTYPGNSNNWNTTTTVATVNAGPVAGGVVGGIVGLIVIIAIIVWWKKKQAAEALAMAQINSTGNNDNGGTTIIMNNTPQQPAYGMQPQPMYNQPMMNQPMMNPYQPGYAQPPPMYAQPQPGPIIIHS